MILIIDGQNMAYRAIYTLQLTHKGKDVSVLYGVLKMLYTLVKNHNPRSIVVCWDDRLPPYRRALVPVYKHGRKKEGGDFIDWDRFHEQLYELCYRVMPMHGILSLRRPYCEADDLMYHAARLSKDRPYVVTRDADMLQAVDKRTSFLDPVVGNIISYDNFERQIGVPPETYVLYKTMVGDGSDNIPGVKQVGPKTASKLIKVMIDNAYPFGYEHDGQEYKLLCDLVSTDRRAQRLVECPEWAFWRMYECIDLTYDRCGAHKTIYDTEWRAADVNRMRKWLMSKGFLSLLEEGAEYTGAFSKLVCPEFKTERHPIPEPKEDYIDNPS